MWGGHSCRASAGRRASREAPQFRPPPPFAKRAPSRARACVGVRLMTKVRLMLRQSPFPNFDSPSRNNLTPGASDGAQLKRRSRSLLGVPPRGLHNSWVIYARCRVTGAGTCIATHMGSHGALMLLFRPRNALSPLLLAVLAHWQHLGPLPCVPASLCRRCCGSPTLRRT